MLYCLLGKAHSLDLEKVPNLVRLLRNKRMRFAHCLLYSKRYKVYKEQERIEDFDVRMLFSQGSGGLEI